MALLALRTTVKPDIGASPAELVYGEGLAVPGDLLPSLPGNNAELNRQQQATLSGLRLEVERLQPKQTSSHRIPDVHIPKDLESATHVMIRRGGVNPPLTQPFEGPFRIDSRTQTGVKVHLPGRGIEEIALARVKPAYSEEADPDENYDNLEDQAPPSPPPPGRRPGPRTRMPEPTQRTTRQNRRTDATDPEPQRYDPGEGTSAQVQNQPQTPEPDSNQEPNQSTPSSEPQAQDLAPSDASPAQNPERDPSPTAEDPPSQPHPTSNNTTPRLFTKKAQRTFSNRGGPVPQSLPQTRPAGRPSQTFSSPQPGNFSFRRRRPDVSALSSAIFSHLNS